MDLFKDLLKGIPWDRALGGPRELVNVQATIPPSSRPVYPQDQKITQRWQDTCMDQQEAPTKSQTQERNLWMWKKIKPRGVDM